MLIRAPTLSTFLRSFARAAACWLSASMLIAACGDNSDSNTTAAIGDCPDLTGTWHSSEYTILSVSADGSHEELTGATMTLDIREQEGCHFYAVSSWQAGEERGTEYAAGVLNPDGNWLTVLEVGDHPVDGGVGRGLGRLLDSGHITFEFASYSDDAFRANVFSTILAREGEALEREQCPDMQGTWIGYPFDALNVFADGSTTQQTDTSNVIQITHQSDCTFRGTNTWMRGDLGGSEHIAGVLHNDGVLITMLEVGPHPEQGTRAFMQASLAAPDVLLWDYAGISEDTQKGQAISTALYRDAEPEPRESCPDLTGRWAVDEWNGLRVHSDGTHEPITGDFHDFEIREQVGCTLMGISTYGPSDGRGGDWSESWVGVINPEQGLLIMRAVAPHSESLASMLFARIASDTELHAEYSGLALDGSSALVYLQIMTKK